jgi:hypothetical protein
MEEIAIAIGTAAGLPRAVETQIQAISKWIFLKYLLSNAWLVLTRRFAVTMPLAQSGARCGRGQNDAAL